MIKKQFLILTLFFCFVNGQLLAQAKKPIIMILPSDNWCEQRYFMTEIYNEGIKQRVPNYKQVFQEDVEIGQVITKIGALMSDRGFPLKDAEQELKSIEERKQEVKVITSKTSGSLILETPLDKLKNRAKADILIQIWWKVTKTDQGRVVSFILEAFDTYTSKRVASSSGSSVPNSIDVVPVLLQNAVLANIEPFTAQLQSHFDDMYLNGREIIVTIRKWANWDKNFETIIDGKELSEHINQWMRTNTVNGRFSISETNENSITYDQVRIPLYDSNKVAVDSRHFARDLQVFFKSAPFNFDVKLMTRGLGEATLVFGEK